MESRQFTPEELNQLTPLMEDVAARIFAKNNILATSNKENINDLKNEISKTEQRLDARIDSVKSELKDEGHIVKIDLREDVSKLERKIDTRIDKLEQKLDNFATKDDIKRLDARIDRVEQSIKDLTKDISSNFKWTITTIIGAVAAIAGILKFFH